MHHWEFSSSRQEISLPRADPRRYLLRASLLDHARYPCGQHRSGSLTTPDGCRNIWRPLSQQRSQSARCSANGPGMLPEEYGHHRRTLTLRHRRTPEEPEVAEPREANPSGEEDTVQEQKPARSEGTETESRYGNPSRCPDNEET